jgi:hypothetical protein
MAITNKATHRQMILPPITINTIIIIIIIIVAMAMTDAIVHLITIKKQLQRDMQTTIAPPTPSLVSLT